jgi:hypothetical protein
MKTSIQRLQISWQYVNINYLLFPIILLEGYRRDCTWQEIEYEF